MEQTENRHEYGIIEKTIGIIILVGICLIVSGLAAGYFICNYMIPNTQAEHSLTNSN